MTGPHSSRSVRVTRQRTNVPFDQPTLRGKTVLVTGGGSGLGAAICRSLCDAQAAVVVADIRGAAATAVAASLVTGGGVAQAMEIDVADPPAAQRCVEQVLDLFHGIDVLINNAGTDVTCSVDDLTFAQWDRVMRTNLYGPFLLSRQVAPHMRRAGQGDIVNIISTAAKRAWPNAAAYHASKWGLLGFSHALHAELRTHNVKVTAVVAGGMRTPFLLDRFPDIDPATLQDPANVAATVRFVLTMPRESVIPEVMVLPMRESSWP